jgi:hypothetical protein
LVVLVSIAGCGGDGDSASGTTSTTASLRALTRNAGADLQFVFDGECSCDVDTSTPGVVRVLIIGGVDSDVLAKAGQDSGLWTAADAARMMETRALDGMVKSSSGRTTWTYHPDDGLQIVADVG